MKKLIALLTLAGITVTASAAPKQSGFIKKFDADKDGQVSFEEFEAKFKNKKKAPKVFKRKDKDGDGFISNAESKAGGKKKKK